MNREQIIEKLRNRVPYEGVDRGDHNLNPTMGKCNVAIPAAVLVPLVERKEGITTLLTQRTQHLENHPGQISFPGGHVDPKVISAEETALRETEEEVGLNRRHITVIGRLDQYRVRTGFDGGYGTI